MIPRVFTVGRGSLLMSTSDALSLTKGESLLGELGGLGSTAHFSTRGTPR